MGGVDLKPKKREIEREKQKKEKRSTIHFSLTRNEFSPTNVCPSLFYYLKVFSEVCKRTGFIKP